MIGVRQDVLKLSGNLDLAALIGEDFKQTGALGVLKSWEEGLQELAKKGYVSSYHMAQTYARMEDKSQALKSLEHALEQRDTNLTYIKVEPAFGEIRSDPRFQALLQRLDMPK